MYVYKIFIVPTNQFYIGSRTSKVCDFSELGETYFSSSADTQKLLFTYGIQNCKFELIKIFDNAKECRTYEEKLISENVSNPLCINKPKGWPSFTEKVRKERNKKISNSVKTHWDENKLKRSEQNKGRSWALTEEQRKEMSKRVSKNFSNAGTKKIIGTIWITNGEKVARHPKNLPLPENWYPGRSKTFSENQSKRMKGKVRILHNIDVQF